MNYGDRHSSLEEIAEELQKFVDSGRSGFVLDVGCVRGRDLRFFFGLIGIDLSRKLLHAVKDSGAEVQLMDMQDTGIRRKVFNGL